jgi:hypothetical protein
MALVPEAQAGLLLTSMRYISKNYIHQMMLQLLSGRWYLASTNFSMWKHSKVCNVTFNYTLCEKDKVAFLLDEVQYVKRGKPGSIKGYDFLDVNYPNRFIWKGKGWMFWIKCPWRIEWMNEAKTCIVLSFEKTLLTGGGVDIITREKSPSTQVLDEACLVISESERLRKEGANAIRVLQQ